MAWRPTRQGAAVRRLLAAALAAAGAAAGSAGPALAAPEWRFYTPGDRSFEVLMPGSPARQDRSSWSPFGRVRTQVHISRLEDRLFAVNSTPLPRMAIWMGVDSYVFETTRKRLLRENDAEERSYEDWSRGGWDGKVLLFDSPQVRDRPAWHWRAEIYVASGRLLVFVANVPAGTSTADLDRFFESVTIAR